MTRRRPALVAHSALVACVVSVVSVGAACISGDQRREGDTLDAVSELADGVDRFDTRDATRPPEIQFDAPAEAELDVEAEAHLDAEPMEDVDPVREVEPGPDAEVTPAECVGEGSECDDHDVCTGPGTCRGGSCAPGAPLTCNDGASCGHTWCDPARGCVVDIVEDGYCDAGRGADWGSCERGRMAPPDFCTAAGLCGDGATGAAVPLPSDLVRGDWFVSAVRAPGGLGYDSVKGTLHFDEGDVLHGIFHDAGGFFGVSDETPERAWCIDGAAGVGFDFWDTHWTGQVDPDGETLAASAPEEGAILVGVRSRGEPTSADGLYAVVRTGIGYDERLASWTGLLDFSDGCVGQGGFFNGGTEGEPFAVPALGGCFQVSANGVAISLELEDGDVKTLDGAIGPRGEVIVLGGLAPGSVPPRADIGTWIMVRLRTDTPAASFVGSARWMVARQERDDIFSAIFEAGRGALVLDGAIILNGVLDAEPVYGGMLRFGGTGRFMSELATPAGRRFWNGYVSASGGFALVWEVDRPEAWDGVVDTVPEAPAHPAAIVMVRRPGL